jgi:hypothetical protein
MSRVETREWLNKLLDVLTGYIREKSRRSSSSESTRFQPDDARAEPAHALRDGPSQLKTQGFIFPD